VPASTEKVVSGGDTPPVAHAGPDQELHDLRAPVYLSGENSTDDHGIIKYYWSMARGPHPAAIVVSRRQWIHTIPFNHKLLNNGNSTPFVLYNLITICSFISKLMLSSSFVTF